MSLSEAIRVIGARQHTLKNLTVSFPRHKLIVLCGWSGSGKTTLAFDTLYAEGFSSYVESLSTYIRQFLPRMPRPDVDKIEGLAPAIALQQSRFTGGFRSIVAGLSELYPYLRLLFARAGKLYSPVSGQPIERYTLEEVLEFLLHQPVGTEIWVLKPLPEGVEDRLPEGLHKLVDEGYDRFVYEGRLYEWPEIPDIENPKEVYILVDRIFIDPSEVELRARLRESLEEVWYVHNQQVWVWVQGKGEFFFSGSLYADGYTFREPTPELFNYMSSYGACPHCQGKGYGWSLQERLVIPDPRKSLREGAVALWAENAFMEEYLVNFMERAQEQVPPDLPYYAYSPWQRRLLWWGEPLHNIYGIFASYEMALKKRRDVQTLSKYRGQGPCPACEGTRLHPDTKWIRIQERSLPQILGMSIEGLYKWLHGLKLPEPQNTIAAPLLQALRHRTEILLEVGLGYLTLDRAGDTLSGGESQRLQLATVLGSQLTGAIYVLDEPTIGLHPRDTERLLRVVQHLRDAPNTVVVVEHDETFIREADYIIEMGPEAGEKGGEVIFAGDFSSLLRASTPTAAYFHRPAPPLPDPPSFPSQNFICVEGACLHNLKNISISFPAQALTVITGVSGSGKTTLAQHLIGPAIQQSLLSLSQEAKGEIKSSNPYTFQRLSFPTQLIRHVEILSQHTLNRNRRSIIATVSGAYDTIRELFAQASKAQGDPLPASYFSFNVAGGRCDTCQGEGVIIKSMQFLADIRLPCPTCGGKRFQPFVLEVEIEGKNISEVLNMTVSQALEFFNSLPKIATLHKQAIAKCLQPLLVVGLGYLKLGQATTELSGGEATRLRLLPYLQPDSLPTLFVIDEPTTGLHFDDIQKLIQAFRGLIQRGHTLLVVEHNLNLIAQADWVIDLGPEGGERGGNLIYQGPVRDLLAHPTSYTAAALRKRYSYYSPPSPRRKARNGKTAK
ncbi:MAG: excinuclease ABC subunit UvrA [Bacteroidia bacterium]|nr:excinuclease ABC subunit UvrA [Bacteroidia bacterium]MDW8134072.1 excinuclease ABC subunit UvrA [Bacteroidia bacterium]